MKSTAVGALLILSILSTSALSQTVDEIRTQRLAIASAPGFHPSDLIVLERNAQRESLELWRKGKAVESYDRILKLLQVYPTSLVGHDSAANIFKAIISSARNYGIEGIEEKERYHQEMVRKIEDSILNGTECIKPEDGCQITSPVEVVYALSRLGYKEKASANKTIDSRFYLQITGVTKEGSERLFTFDATAYPDSWRK